MPDINPQVEAALLGRAQYRESHFLATVASVTGAQVSILRNGQTIVEGPYPAAGGLAGAVSAGDTVLVVDATGAGGFVVLAQIGTGAGADWQEIVKAADESVVSDTVIQNDDDFTFAVVANAVYIVEAWINVEVASSIPDLKFTWTVPASATMSGVATTVNAGATVGFVEGAGGAVVALSSGDQLVHMPAIVTVAATAGNAVFGWAQNTSNANPVTLAAGSTLRYRRVL